MKVAHLYPKYHRNVGDHFVQRGILRLLDQRLGRFEYTPLPTRQRGADPNEPVGVTPESVDLLNRHDLVVIGGSNLYEAAREQWGVKVDLAALRRLRAPVLLIGIGGGWSFAYPSFPALPTAAAVEIRELHGMACGSSVRDLLTARLLRAHAIGPCTLTGCPATYLASEVLRPARGGVVGVPFLPRRMYAAASADPRRWRNPTHMRRRSATVFFLKLLSRLRTVGHDVRILVHDAADLPLANELLAGDFFFSEEPERLFEAIGQCDVIVGFRLHASIAALGLGIPPIPILLDGRNAAFVETFGMSEHAVSIDPASVEMVMQRVDLALGSSRSLWQPAFERRDVLRKAMSEFVDSSLAAAPERARSG